MLRPLLLKVLGFSMVPVALVFLVPAWIRILFKFGFGRFAAVRAGRPAPACLQNRRWGEHRYMRLANGLKMHYVEKGDRDKPLMVFLHGFPEFWFSWRYQLEHFAQNYWCVAPDNRGYGDSDTPEGCEKYSLNHLCEDVKDLIHGLGREKCILVGHDWGGSIGYSVCAKYPALVTTYIVCNLPHPLGLEKQMHSSWEQRLMSWYILFFQCPFFPELFYGFADFPIFDRIFGSAKMVYDGEDKEQIIEAYKYTFSKPNGLHAPMNYYRHVFQFPDAQLKTKLCHIRVPVLSIFGTGDIALSVTANKLSRNYVEQYSEVYIDGASHWVQMDSAKEVNKAMEEHLKGF